VPCVANRHGANLATAHTARMYSSKACSACNDYIGVQSCDTSLALRIETDPVHGSGTWATWAPGYVVTIYHVIWRWPWTLQVLV